FRTLLLLFVALRVQATLFLAPGGSLYLGSDFRFYRDVAALAYDGALPWVGYWSEYPPLFPWLVTGLLWLSSFMPAWPNELTWFQIVLGLVLTAADVTNLALIHAIGKRLGGEERGLAVAMVWALLFFPLFLTLNWFDTLPLMFLLLGLWLVVAGRAAPAGLAIAAGILAKLIPGLVVFVALRRWWPDRRPLARFGGALVALLMMVLLPLAVAGPDMTRASIMAMVERPPWLTVWALMEGYTGLGFMPPVPERLNPEMAHWQIYSPTLPWSLIQIVFLAALIWLFSRRLDWQSPRVLVAATGLSLVLFLFFAKGHSPQFIVYVLPFLVLLLPGFRGVAWAIALQAVTLAEWPIAYVILAQESWLAPTAIIIRTAMYAMIAVEFTAVIAGQPIIWPRHASQFARGGSLAVLVALAVVVVARVPDQGLHPQVADFLHPDNGPGRPGQAVVVTTQKLRWQLIPLLTGTNVIDLSDTTGLNDSTIEQTLDQVASEHGAVWVVADYRYGDEFRRALVEGYLGTTTPLADDRWFDHLRVRGYANPEALPIPDWRTVRANYAGGPTITGWSLVGGKPSPGQRIRVALRWESSGLDEATAGAFGERKLFVHLLDSTGELVGQSDTLLQRSAGEEPLRAPSFVTIGDLAIDPTAVLGPGRLVIGLYDRVSGKRYAFETGDALEVDGPRIVE
ncbi:MAG TPA: hypothetical protein VMP10_00015, partial [Chloroflexota bacterium]|nr:hypothetical protein [Chloroflexota bacterium]